MFHTGINHSYHSYVKDSFLSNLNYNKSLCVYEILFIYHYNNVEVVLSLNFDYA